MDGQARVIFAAAHKFGVTPADVCDPRHRKGVAARRWACGMLRDAGWSLKRIAKALGYRGHQQVIHQLRRRSEQGVR